MLEQNRTEQNRTEQNRTEQNRTEQNIIIAGNAPSLAEIDYSRLPRHFDIFRTNQFYMEEKYFLGKKIRAVFMNPSVGFEQYCTLKNLMLNGEYEIGEIYLACGGDSRAYFESYHRLSHLFPEIKSTREILDKLTPFDNFIRFHEFCFNKRVSSGIFMVAIAIAQGYKNIYLAGIDMFTNQGNLYAFDVLRFFYALKSV